METTKREDSDEKREVGWLPPAVETELRRRAEEAGGGSAVSRSVEPAAATVEHDGVAVSVGHGHRCTSQQQKSNF